MSDSLFSTGRPVIKAKTAAYTMTPDDEGTIFTNRGAVGSVTFTLPPVTYLPAGFKVSVFVVANQEVVIAANGSADNIVGFNDAGADTLTITTDSEHIGAGADLIWDGTGWLCFLHTEETQTVAFA